MAVTKLEPLTSVKRACELLGKSRATLHRQRATPSRPPEKHRPGRGHRTPRLTAAEQAALLALLDSERFADKSPAQVYAILLDDGIYLASIRTMYRVDARGPGPRAPRPGRPSAPGPARACRRRPGPGLDLGHHQAERTLRGTYSDLYVMLDIFSRKAICWEAHYGESGDLAKAFMQHAIAANGGARPHYIHADNGTSMTSKNVATLLTDLNITRSHSRPHVSNDNPFSEAAFKTFKYCPVFRGPGGGGSRRPSG